MQVHQATGRKGPTIATWCPDATASAWSSNETDEPHTFLLEVCICLSPPKTASLVAEECPEWRKDEKAGKSHTLQRKMSEVGCKVYDIWLNEHI